MRKYIFASAVAATLAALVVSACGGGEPTATPVPPTATIVPPTATRAPALTATTAPGVPPAPTPAATARPTAVGGSPAAPPTAAPTPAAVATPAATATASSLQPKYGGVLRHRQFIEFASWNTWDSQGSGGFACYNICTMMNNMVVHSLDGTRVEGDLAQSWDLSGDGLTYTFRIRQGVKWHDGTPLTSADIAWNLQRGWKPPEPTLTFNLRRFLTVQSIETPDPATVKVTLSRPNAAFLDSMATRFILMYPPHIPAASWKNNPIGTGPFKFKSFRRDNDLVVVRNPDYFKKDASGRALPYLDSVEGYFIVDSALSLSAFRTGRIECGCMADGDFLTPNVDTLTKAIPGLKTWSTFPEEFNLIFNFNKAPFNDLRVRQAFSALLDRKEVARLPWGGGIHFPPDIMKQKELGGRWGLEESELLALPGFRDPKVDADYAAGLFKEAGIDPKTLKLLFEAIDSLAVKAYHEAGYNVLAQRSGAQMRFNVEATAPMTQTLKGGGWELSMTTGGSNFDDPDDSFMDYVTTNGSRNPAGLDYGLDQLAAQQNTTIDVAKRKQLVWEIQRKLIRDATFVPAVYKLQVNATYPYIEGYQPPTFSGGSLNFRMEQVWLNK